MSYIIGLQKNSRMNEQVALAELALAEQYTVKRTKQRMFGEFEYAAKTWDRTRRVIARLEHGEQGVNPRFIVTDLPGSAKALYERRYCARGEAENRIKEAQLDLFGRRASCHRFQANQLRLLLAALAYTLMTHPSSAWQARRQQKGPRPKPGKRSVRANSVDPAGLEQQWPCCHPRTPTSRVHAARRTHPVLRS